jgi:hypothetical protein
LGQSATTSFISKSKTTGGTTQLTGGVFIYFVSRVVTTANSHGVASVLSDNNDWNPSLNNLSASVVSPVFYYPNEQNINIPPIQNGTYDIFVLGFSDTGFGVTGKSGTLTDTNGNPQQTVTNVPIITGLPYCGRVNASSGNNSDGSVTLSGGSITLSSTVSNDFCAQIKSTAPTNVTYLASGSGNYSSTLQQPATAATQVAGIFSNWLVPFTMIANSSNLNIFAYSSSLVGTVAPMLSTPANRYSDIQQIQSIEDSDSNTYYGIQDDNPNTYAALSQRFISVSSTSFNAGTTPTGLANIFTPTYFVMCRPFYAYPNDYALQSQDFSSWYPSGPIGYSQLCSPSTDSTSSAIQSVRVVIASDMVFGSGAGILTTEAGGITSMNYSKLMTSSENLAPVSMCIPLINQVYAIKQDFSSALNMGYSDALSKQIPPALLPSGNVSSFNGSDVNPLRIPTWVFAYPNTNCSNAPSKLYEFTPNLAIVQEKFYRNPTLSSGTSSVGSGTVDLSQNIRVYAISDPSVSGTGTLTQINPPDTTQANPTYTLPAEIMDWNFSTNNFGSSTSPSLRGFGIPYLIGSMTSEAGGASIQSYQQMYTTRLKLIVLH